MRTRFDPFIVGIVATAVIALVLPLGGDALDVTRTAVPVAIGLLFFLYGARLAASEALHGISRWRLQVAILATTFVLFPLIGIAARPLLAQVVDDPLATGFVFICLLPSTVQSSITMTSIAGGNVAGAVVGASLSNVLGVFITPLLVALLIGAGVGGFNTEAIVAIVAILLLPFIAGQLSRRWLSETVQRHDSHIRIYDRFAIIFVIYVAFSEGTRTGVRDEVSAAGIAWIVAACVLLLAIAGAATYAGGRALGMPRTDRVPLVFCGTQKSLAMGLPIATVLFERSEVALIIVPAMIYYQLQIVGVAVLASRWRNAA